MSPSHTRKGGVLYRYYVSQALLRGRKRGTRDGGVGAEAGPGRIPAAAVEEAVVAALRPHPRAAVIDAVGTAEAMTSGSAARALVERWVERITARAEALTITLRAGGASAAGEGDGRQEAADEIVVPWSSRRPNRAAVLLPDTGPTEPGRTRRAMPEDVRRHLLVSIARARAWADALASGGAADTAALAERAGCSERHVRMLLPLAGLAPDLIESAIEGRLPAGYGAARLCRDLPASWAEQRGLIPLIPLSASARHKDIQSDGKS